MDARNLLMERYERHRDDMTQTDCWRSKNDKCMPHFHASVELVYVYAGELTAIVDGKTYRVGAGRMLLVSGYAVHTYYTERENDVLLLIMPLSFVPSLQKTLHGKAFAGVVYDARADRKLTALLALIADDWRAYGRETQKGFTYALLDMLIARVGLTEPEDAARGAVMRDAMCYLQENYQKEARLAELARRFGYSKSRFSHLFNNTVGCSPRAYVNALRCRQAARALLESDQPLADIALGAGFECLRTFYRAFKQVYGMTPTQYQRAQQAGG